MPITPDIAHQLFSIPSGVKVMETMNTMDDLGSSVEIERSPLDFNIIPLQRREAIREAADWVGEDRPNRNCSFRGSFIFPGNTETGDGPRFVNYVVRRSSC